MLTGWLSPWDADWLAILGVSFGSRISARKYQSTVIWGGFLIRKIRGDGAYREGLFLSSTVAHNNI
jgi:hypothetical protein